MNGGNVDQWDGKTHEAIPIERGRDLRNRRQDDRHTNTTAEAQTLRRLMQCVEMMRELALDVARSR